MEKKNERNDCLVQWIDIAPTLLEYFNLPIPKDMQGKPLKEVVAKDEPIHDYVAYGVFGGQANITDGKYTYIRGPKYPENVPLYEYTLMPTHLKYAFSVEEMQKAEFVKPFNFTKDCSVLKIPGVVQNMCTSEFWSKWKTELYDIENDYDQESCLDDKEVEQRMLKALEGIMLDSDAPVEQYVRLGMDIPEVIRNNNNKV